jgi:hypothetical protein
MARGELFPIINSRDVAAAQRFYEAVFGGVLVIQDEPADTA